MNSKGCPDEDNPITILPVVEAVAEVTQVVGKELDAEEAKPEQAATDRYDQKDRKTAWLNAGCCCLFLFLVLTASGVTIGVILRKSSSNDDNNATVTDVVPPATDSSSVPSNSVVLVGEKAVSDFPIPIHYALVEAPKKLPFEVHGSFKATSDQQPDHPGILSHETNCKSHETCEGFKIFLTPEGYLRLNVAQYTSYYNVAWSHQTNLHDGEWHSFVARVSEQTISVEVDGVMGEPVGTTDERGVQEQKKFGRVIHSSPYVVGDDPDEWDERIFVGEIRNVFIVEEQ